MACRLYSSICIHDYSIRNKYIHRQECDGHFIIHVTVTSHDLHVTSQITQTWLLVDVCSGQQNNPPPPPQKKKKKKTQTNKKTTTKTNKKQPKKTKTKQTKKQNKNIIASLTPRRHCRLALSHRYIPVIYKLRSFKILTNERGCNICNVFFIHNLFMWSGMYIKDVRVSPEPNLILTWLCFYQTWSA